MTEEERRYDGGVAGAMERAQVQRRERRCDGGQKGGGLRQMLERGLAPEFCAAAQGDV